MPRTSPRRALIVEPGRSRGALAAARALHAAGWEVGAAAPSQGLAASSRDVRWRHDVPRVDADVDEFISAVDRACAEVGYRLVFGADDAEVLALTEARDRLRADVPHAPAAALAEAVDKSRLEARAREAGLTVPQSFAADADDLPSGPLVVKPALRRRAGPRRASTELAPDADAARARASRLTARGEGAFLQEQVEGSLLSLAVVAAHDGRIVAAVQQRADRTFPPRTGMSAHAVTVPVDPDLLERVGRLLAGLGWFGLAQLQFVGPSEGDPALVDVNARFYGSMELAIAAGPNLPAIWAGLAVGDDPPAELLLGRPGVEYQWLEGDLRRAFSEHRGGLVRDVLTVLRPSPGRRGAIWSARDPVPALSHTARLAGLALRRGNPAR